MNEAAEPAVEAVARSGDELVVGIGASAGGIAALKRFFGAVAPDAGMSYVVILHLSPDHESNLAQVLQSSSRIPIRQVRETVRIERDHAYVVPPSMKLAMEDGHIHVSEITSVEERRAPIDMFLRSLADSHRARAVSVILSGTGADGSMGLKRVKEFGGLCIAQDPDDADFSGMPRSAIATMLLDYVLPADQIPARLAAYRRHLQVVTVPEEEDAAQCDKALSEIFTQLRVRTGHDFSNYKRSTLLRRIERRMNVHEVGALADYARFLRDNRDEPRALLKDLLISVTNFFRDAEAFRALEAKVLQRLFESKRDSDNLRVWVPGCATGEEAYSIAMLLAEHAREASAAPEIQVFATDIDETALTKARAGLYTLNEVADVPQKTLRRFFLREANGYRVQRELREMVLFASHNVIKDPPFSHLDLVSCRNLMIYMNGVAQERLIKLLHFGLSPGGYLFLGNSESAEQIQNLFVAVDKEHHIYQSRPIEASLPPAVHATLPRVAAGEAAAPGVEQRIRERMSFLDLHHRVLEKYAPPSVLVNAEFDIVHFSDKVGRFLQFGPGEPTQNLLKVVRPELRPELHGALFHAVQQNVRTEAVAGPVDIDGATVHVSMVVSPVLEPLDPSSGLVLVTFESLARGQAPGAGSSPIQTLDNVAHPVAQRLEEELARVNSQLRGTIEQYELQQEEFKASNEELEAMNEELRSSSEELQTSREELQSLNEELTTVNQELKIKIEEVTHANDDLRNLMNSTELATVFVDRDLRVKLFSPRARGLFSLIPNDVGRPLLDITSQLSYPELRADIEKVLETLSIIEREVHATDGRAYISRVLPYRTADERIDGIVLTFTDISDRKRIEEAWRLSEESVRLMVETVPDHAVFTLDSAGKIRTWNVGAMRMFGWSHEEAVGREGAIIFTPEDRAAGAPGEEMRQARETGHASGERWHLRKDGSRIFVSSSMAPLSSGGRLIGYTKVARDLTARQRQQAEEGKIRLLHDLVQVQEEERRRISRELHDQLGQEITTLGLRLAIMRSAPEALPTLRAEIEKLETLVKHLDDDVEFLVWQLRPTGLDELGLADALSDYLAGWTSHFGVKAQLRANLPERLPGDVETALYRISQEALNNVAKHARAREVTVALEARDEHVVLTIQDDGLGFEMGRRGGGRSFGLVGMNERAALVGGEARIDSAPDKGTRITVTVPLRE